MRRIHLMPPHSGKHEKHSESVFSCNLLGGAPITERNCRLYSAVWTRNQEFCVKCKSPWRACPKCILSGEVKLYRPVDNKTGLCKIHSEALRSKPKITKNASVSSPSSTKNHQEREQSPRDEVSRLKVFLKRTLTGVGKFDSKLINANLEGGISTEPLALAVKLELCANKFLDLAHTICDSKNQK